MKVYKDECVYTCDTTESDHGIDVCLNCFIGTSPNPLHDFTKAHHRHSGHAAFLNLHKVPKPEPETNSQLESGKLEIKAQSDDTKFDIISTFKSLDDTLKEDAFKEQIETVLKSDSTARIEEIQAWELQIEPCEHVAMLESCFESSTESNSNNALNKCSRCEMDNNLWICLWCGEVSCGRPQFGGGGGNGHALEHFATTSHSLAVKLGSITAEGKADVYCYACDDEVSDPEVSKHLKKYGIDISKRSKTEKSMTELQLEQNMKWDFSGSEGAELVSGSGLTGMKNLGNTCYLNSCIQSLFTLQSIRQYFPPNRPIDSDLVSDPADNLLTQLRRLQDGLYSGDHESISPLMLKVIVGKNHSEFATMHQQDAFEYWGHLLGKITSAYPGKDPIKETFGFATERRTECNECHAVKYMVEGQESLSLNVPIETQADNTFRPVRLKELFQNMVKPESLEEYDCPGCSKHTIGTSAVGIKTFPKVLVVNARRFRVVNWVPEKVDVPVIVPPEGLSLGQYHSKGPQVGEHIIEDQAFVADENALQLLTGAGFEREKCIAALEAGKNDPETAMNFLLDPGFSGKPANNSGVDAGALDSLEAMGFTGPLASAALRASNNSVEAAMEWIFAGHTEADAPPVEESSEHPSPTDLGFNTPGAGYKLSSVICHKGTSVHVGHYVAAIEKNGQWYLFNDEKVSKGANIEELQKYAYMYILERVD